MFYFLKFIQCSSYFPSFSAQSPFFNLKLSSFARAMVGSVSLVTHLTSSVLHHFMHSFWRSPPSQVCMPAIRTFLQIFSSSLSLLSIAMGILPSRVAVILAASPSSWIWSPRYFYDLEFSMIISPIMMGLSAASFRISVHDWGDPITIHHEMWLRSVGSQLFGL